MRLNRHQGRDYIYAALAWIAFSVVLWYPATQDPPPDALSGIESVCVFAALVFFLVPSLGARRLAAVASRRRGTAAPLVEVHMEADVIGRAVDIDRQAFDAQVIMLAFNEQSKRYQAADDA